MTIDRKLACVGLSAADVQRVLNMTDADFQWRSPSDVDRLMEQWYASTSVQWLAPGCCRVFRSDDGITAGCEIDLLGKLGVV